MKIWENLKKWLGKATLKPQRKYYKLDDIILYNWLQCTEGKYNFARIGATDEDVIDEEDMKAFEKIYSDYIDKYGINDLYKQYLNLAKKRAIAQLDYVATKKKFAFNIIRVMDAKIEDIKKQMNKGISTESVLVHLSKFMGFRQDPKKMTFVEYLSLVKEYERTN
jgi:hypothetical protein